MFQYHQSYQSYQYTFYLSFTQRRTGRVKFFNVKKGYGFIIPDSNGSKDEGIKREINNEKMIDYSHHE